MLVVSGDYSSASALCCAAPGEVVLRCFRRTEEMREIGGAAPAPGGTTLGSGRLARLRIPASEITLTFTRLRARFDS
jgi:hypothetical protein